MELDKKKRRVGENCAPSEIDLTGKWWRWWIGRDIDRPSTLIRMQWSSRTGAAAAAFATSIDRPRCAPPASVAFFFCFSHSFLAFFSVLQFNYPSRRHRVFVSVIFFSFFFAQVCAPRFERLRTARGSDAADEASLEWLRRHRACFRSRRRDIDRRLRPKRRRGTGCVAGSAARGEDWRRNKCSITHGTKI